MRQVEKATGDGSEGDQIQKIDQKDTLKAGKTRNALGDQIELNDGHLRGAYRKSKQPAGSRPARATLAASRRTVFDPFGGSGTVGIVRGGAGAPVGPFGHQPRILHDGKGTDG